MSQRHWGRELSTGAGAIAARPWYGPSRVVLSIARTTSAEEFTRLEPGFNAAYRRLWDCAWRSKRRAPIDKQQGILADAELEASIGAILAAWEANPLYQDAQPGTRADEVRLKLGRLIRFCIYLHTDS
jgi:hypothetical protein